MPERDELDQLIDSVLNTYAEPRPGLEQRTRARISQEVTLSLRRRRFVLAIAAPVLASLILFTYLLGTSPHSRPGHVAFIPAVPSPAPHEAMAPEPRPAPKALSGTPGRQRVKTPKQIEAKAIQRPKLDMFPTPHPLNPEEEALTRFGTEGPETDRKALIEAQRQITEPLRISAIHIRPLEPPEQEKY